MPNNLRTNLHEIETYVQACMNDSAHDMEHVYRVLNYATHIARCETGVNMQLLTAACLLHDIGRAEQFADATIDHAVCGADKAYKWLVENGYSHNFASEVKNCIQTHRYRSNNPPQSLEAIILFDADKLEACGTMGIARGLFYKGHVSEPLYSLTEEGRVSDGANDSKPSFFQEYKFKLENVYDRFHTKRGLELAVKRKAAAENFYNSMLAEVRECYQVES